MGRCPERRCADLKNKVLRTLTIFAMLIFLIGVCGLDSEGTNIFFILILSGLAWLVPYLLINWDTIVRENESKER